MQCIIVIGKIYALHPESAVLGLSEDRQNLLLVHMEEGCQFGDLDKLKSLSLDDNPMVISRDKIIFT